MRLSSWLYRSARLANDVEAITPGDPKRIARRAKNKVVGRLLGKAALWRPGLCGPPMIALRRS